MTRDGIIDQHALEAARVVDTISAQVHRSDTQRRARFQIAIRDAIVRAIAALEEHA